MGRRRRAMVIAIGVACAGVVTTVVTAAAAGPSAPARMPDQLPAKTIPTLPAEPEPAGSIPDSVPPDTALVTGPDAARDTGIGLRAAAAPAELVALVGHLRTQDDIAAQLEVLAPLSVRFPSPAGADLVSIDVVYDVDDPTYELGARFRSTGTADDLVAFFQARLVGTGYQPAAAPATGVDDDADALTTLSYRAPGGVDLTIAVHDATSARAVDVTVHDHFRPDVLQAFTGWTPGLPLVDLTDNPPVRAVLALDTTSVSLSTSYLFTATSVDELADRFREALGSSARYRLADGAAANGRTLEVSAPAPIGEIRIRFEPSGDDSRLTVSGSL